MCGCQMTDCRPSSGGDEVTVDAAVSGGVDADVAVAVAVAGECVSVSVAVHAMADHEAVWIEGVSVAVAA